MRNLKKLQIHLPILLKSAVVKLSPALYNSFRLRRHLANIILTHRCNLKCIMCRQWRSDASGRELDTAGWKSVISQFKECGICDVHFTGGEPLLREDLSELARYAADLKYRVGLTTNGYLLTDALIRDLIDSGVSSLAISIDALNGDYERIRGVKDAYAKAERALRLLSAYRAKGKIAAYINFTLMKPSLPQFHKVKRLADSLGLPVAVCLLDESPYFFKREENSAQLWLDKELSADLAEFVTFLLKEKKRSPASLIITPSAIGYISGYFIDPVQKEIPCIASQTRVFLDPYGNIMGGCLAMGCFGNLKDSSLKELLNADRLKRFQKDMFYKKCPGCSCGYLYNLQHYLPSRIADILKH